jgi:hypothetical protein
VGRVITCCGRLDVDGSVSPGMRSTGHTLASCVKNKSNCKHETEAIISQIADLV